MSEAGEGKGQLNETGNLAGKGSSSTMDTNYMPSLVRVTLSEPGFPS